MFSLGSFENILPRLHYVLCFQFALKFERDIVREISSRLINICYINFNIKQGKTGGVRKSGRKDKNSSN